ncbi:OmpA family protein [Lamprobacter modestohalophilus]|uniref:OmpA family protein n=1 Tax=Lamprobacter modestohalophilus TaxID=1064514 RepID=UPI002ADEBAE2|nr:OmpA family protein [Lamprobacter modestohalophilus]MEA1052385.1 OmpA family protein [Lamprobacter modestohalophilus]
MPRRLIFAAILALAAPFAATAADIDGIVEHPMIDRYPGQSIRWQTIENYRPYRIPTGPVTGYRTIDDWIDIEGRVTRTYYTYKGTDRSWDEIFLNFRDAFELEQFESLGIGFSDDRRGVDIGSRQWLNAYLAENPLTGQGEVLAITSGSSSQGGQGVFVGTKDRASGRVYVVVTVEQHSQDLVATLIDVVEVKPPETGFVVVGAEAIGRDMIEKGHVVLDGILFDFDKATLQAASDEALGVIAGWLKQNPGRFYVVGHTDAVGSFDYNQSLSEARAQTVIEALVDRYGIARERLQGHGVGPLVPVFSNADEAARDRNRRVELVEWPE